MSQIRPLAIYLPQFHQNPENDHWWGKGFTEWTNVTRARPLIKGHYQPHLPSVTGFYNLADPEIRESQAEMARKHGIFGFCYYHYWFNGKRLLKLPLDEVLETGRPDYPLCLAWANEDWTRSWDGESGEILIKQHYHSADDLAHIRFLCNIFADSRYIRINGKPFFIVYKPFFLPDPKRTLEIWREEALRLGIGELYLGYFENEIQFRDPAELGFDCAIEFQPNWWKLPPPLQHLEFLPEMEKFVVAREYREPHRLYDYVETMKIMIDAGRNVKYKRFRCVTPMWDNSPRRKHGATVFLNSNPDNYEIWLRSVVRDFSPFSPEENFIFMNAWNEWGEGNHLEPCVKWGYAFLERTKKVFDELNTAFF